MSKKTIAGRKACASANQDERASYYSESCARSFHGIGSSARSGSTSGRSLRGRCCGVRQRLGSCGHPGACAAAARTRPVAAFSPEVRAMLQSPLPLVRQPSRQTCTRRRSARLVDHGAYAGHIAAVLEILGGDYAHGPRARIAYAGLHRPTDSRHKTRHLTRNRTTRKPAAYNGCKLLHSIGRKRLPIRGGDLMTIFVWFSVIMGKSAPGMNTTRPIPAFWKAVERTDSIERAYARNRTPARTQRRFSRNAATTHSPIFAGRSCSW